MLFKTFPIKGCKVYKGYNWTDKWVLRSVTNRYVCSGALRSIKGITGCQHPRQLPVSLIYSTLWPTLFIDLWRTCVIKHFLGGKLMKFYRLNCTSFLWSGVLPLAMPEARFSSTLVLVCLQYNCYFKISQFIQFRRQ